MTLTQPRRVPLGVDLVALGGPFPDRSALALAVFQNDRRLTAELPGGVGKRQRRESSHYSKNRGPR